MAEAYNILGEPSGQPVDPADAEPICLKALHHAAAGDPRWAAWLLEHHPSTSSTWSDLAVQYRIEREVVAKVVKAILAYGFNPHDQTRFLLCLQAEGIETIAATVRDSNGGPAAIAEAEG